MPSEPGDSDDISASHIETAVNLQQVDAEYGDNAYGIDDEWAKAVPDLGENA
jgi:hypothetical protein